MRELFLTECYTLLDALIWAIMGAFVMWGITTANKDDSKEKGEDE